MYLDKFDKPGYPILPYVAISSHRMRVNRNRPRVLNTAHFDLLQRHLHMWVRTAGGRFVIVLNLFKRDLRYFEIMVGDSVTMISMMHDDARLPRCIRP